jgi:anaerobic magnesium-protoporphyrin IX monomethyl ester cyclase
MEDWEAAADRASQARARREARAPLVACGGSTKQMEDAFRMPAPEPVVAAE